MHQHPWHLIHTLQNSSFYRACTRLKMTSLCLQAGISGGGGIGIRTAFERSTED